MGFLRQIIRDLTSPMTIKNLNDNFSYIWLKVFGNIDTGDILDGAVTGDKIAYNTVTAKNIKTDELIVGTNIAMGPNAVISWGNLSPDIKLGIVGRNLILNTGTPVTKAGTGWVTSSWKLSNQMKTGDYVISFKYTITVADGIGISLGDSNGVYDGVYELVPTLPVGTNAYYSQKVSFTRGSQANLCFYTNQNITVSELKLEAGSIATSYIPAPEDILPSYITSTKITSTTIESPTITGNSVNAGTMTVGGAVNGSITVKDASGVTVATLDNTGLNVTKGTISGNAINGGTVDGATIRQMSGTKVLAEFTTSTYGGVLFFYNENGDRNINIGHMSDANYSGGTIQIFNDSYSKKTVDITTSRSTGAGEIMLSDSRQTFRAFLSGSYDGNSNDAGLYLWGSTGTFKTYMSERGFYGLGKQPMTTWSPTIPANSSVQVNHNLGYKPIVKFSGTVGNLGITYRDDDANTMTFYNSSAGNNTWTGTISFY